MAVLVNDAQRRARLLARQHLDCSASGPVEATRGVVALHSSDPATPHLALRARVPGFRTEDLDRELCDTRSLWRLHAMRRTLFVVAVDEAEIVLSAASREVARVERRKLEGWLGSEMDPLEVADWLAGVEARVAELLADGIEWSTRDLGAALPELGREITLGSGKWTTRSPLSSRLLFLMALEGRIVRTRAAGSWRSSQYSWAGTANWFGQVPFPLDPELGRSALARRYLSRFGPATLADVRWWTGWTARQAAAAIEEIGAMSVSLEGGAEGLLLPEDVDNLYEFDEVSPSISLLPALDPTPMGWKERDWYLGEHADGLFDRNGNAGPTIWLDGRVVGGWGQRADGEVVCRLLEDVGSEASRCVEEEAAALAEWMGGAVAVPRFRTPLERELTG